MCLGTDYRPVSNHQGRAAGGSASRLADGGLAARSASGVPKGQRPFGGVEGQRPRSQRRIHDSGRRFSSPENPILYVFSLFADFRYSNLVAVPDLRVPVPQLSCGTVTGCPRKYPKTEPSSGPRNRVAVPDFRVPVPQLSCGTATLLVRELVNFGRRNLRFS